MLQNDAKDKIQHDTVCVIYNFINDYLLYKEIMYDKITPY